MRNFILIVFATACFQVFSQDGQVVPFDDGQWSFSGDGYKVIREDGSSVLQLNDGDVKANLKGADFTNGTITYELKFAEARTFLGLSFRMQDAENYESFYVRPHQSGNPDATQYTPVYNDLSAWQLYHGEGYATAVTYQFDQWIPITILVKDQRAEVYFNNNSEPAFHIPHLHREIQSGMLGLWGGKGMVRNFTYTKNDNVTLKTAVKPKERMQPRTITQWQVYTDVLSEQLDENSITDLDDDKWSTMGVDDLGRLNLSKRLKLTEDKNTALVKYTIVSSKAAVKQIDFGFSDRVVVYVNGKPIYKGDNTFRTRDYRFLGSIGYFDSAFLPLKRGINEIIFTVSESFGGWGLIAKLPE
ncbi:hypothetical protein [uncultured Croceitalea sp.]|uniref:hypothetical protein n=1 Tax=uncultured Croceitalea sp. TaxID=1798908 RepID=UPI003305653E